VLTDFYIAFSPACFSLLGLWLVVLQINTRDLLGDPVRRRRAYGIGLHFALPGMMSLLALVDPQDQGFWRVSFAVISVGGAAVLIAVRGAIAGHSTLDNGAHLSAIILYLLIGVLAVVPNSLLREEAVLLVILVFLGFNAAWLLLYDTSLRSPDAETPG
jgi:peptidoglycan/LPS O-acetylase OafA/YrhL